MAIKITKLSKLEKVKITKNSFSTLPQTPGVYIFWGLGRRPIYVGKSKNLKSRLSSYLNINLGPKTKAMVLEANGVSYIKVTSELESLLLEAKLINKFKPKYNISAKDDKRPLYIIITKEEFPRVLAVRNPITYNLKPITLFGPFPNSRNVKTILKLIRNAIPFSDHVAGSEKITKKPCIYSQIGLCSPCPNIVSGVKNQVSRNKLHKQYKKNIKNIKRLLEGKFSEVEKDLLKQMKAYSKKKDYEKAAILRDNLKVIQYITKPQTPAVEFLKNPNLTQDLRLRELESLKKLLTRHLTLDTLTLSQIECFDISHLSGASATASMVVFINGEAEKSKYRHFKIKQAKSQSDYDSMVEVATRRIKHLSDWGKPYLLIIDGGLAQVKAFNEVFKYQNIPVIGIAKHPDRLVFSDGKKIKLSGPALQLVTRIRDEAHRFARRYHHILMKRNLLN